MTRNRVKVALSDVTTVVHVLGSVDRGGVEVRTLEVLQALKPGSVHTSMVTLTGREGALAAEYRAAGARIVPIRLGSPFFAFRFARYLVRERVRTVHSHVFLASGPVLTLARIAGVRNRIAHFQTDGSGHSRVSRIRAMRYALMHKLLQWNATQIIGVSPYSLLQWDENWVEDRRCVVLVHGFDLERFAVAEVGVWRTELGLSNDEAAIVHLGRADLASKNRDGAIDVFAEYARRHDRGTLIFVGRDGNNPDQAAANRARWEAKISGYGLEGRVLFAGERSDVPNVLNSADALLLTSTLEGLPGVVVEARAAGIPVVSTDLPGCKFIASRISGVECLSIDEPVAAWADALEEALHTRPTLASRHAARAELAGSDFDVRISASHYLELWSK